MVTITKGTEDAAVTEITVTDGYGDVIVIDVTADGLYLGPITPKSGNSSTAVQVTGDDLHEVLAVLASKITVNR